MSTDRGFKSQYKVQRPQAGREVMCSRSKKRRREQQLLKIQDQVLTGRRKRKVERGRQKVVVSRVVLLLPRKKNLDQLPPSNSRDTKKQLPATTQSGISIPVTSSGVVGLGRGRGTFVQNMQA